MPSNNGNYTLPPVYLAVAGELIRALQHNAPLEDLAIAINAAVARDGTRPMQGPLPMGGNKITGLAAATAAGDAVNYGQVLASIAPGIIMPFGGSQAPSGSLLCNGSFHDPAAYPPLFAAIGYTYGRSGDLFATPNCVGRVLVGAGTGYGLGSTGGAATVVLTEAQMPSHSHSGSTSVNGDHQHDSGTESLRNNFGGGSAVGGRTLPGGTIEAYQYARTSVSGNHNHSFTTNSRGSNQAHNNMQPYVVVNYIIKT